MAKGECPDALFLTATPIPRTLALALFGNLSLSYIKQRPRNAAPRKTVVHTLADKGRAYDAAQEALARGEQVYVVCPLVGEKREEPESKKGGNGDEEDVYEFASISIEDERDMTGANATAAEAEASFLQSKVFDTKNFTWKMQTGSASRSFTSCADASDEATCPARCISFRERRAM